MMSIFILIGAYRYYAGLAERFGKTKWQFGLLAIAIYLGFQIVFLFGYGMYEAFTGSLNDNNYTGFSLINIISWLFAIAGVYAVYHILEKKFKKENIKKPSLEIDEIGVKE
jgi:Ni/Fe-hydrogenase subunit HybB-like protein